MKSQNTLIYLLTQLEPQNNLYLKYQMQNQITNPNKRGSLKSVDYEEPSAQQRRTYSRWTKQQNEIYANFLKNNTIKFTDEWTRRSTRIFSKLSLVVQTKTQKQCKSHHQKMMGRFGTLQNIVERLGKQGQVVAQKVEKEEPQRIVKVEPEHQMVKFEDYWGSLIRLTTIIQCQRQNYFPTVENRLQLTRKQN